VVLLSHRRRRVWTAVAGLVLLAGCRRAPAEGELSGEVIAVTVQAVRQGPIRDVVRAAGVVAPIPAGDFIVAAAEPAEVLEITKNEGDAVAAGDVLVRLEIASLASEQATRQLEVTDAVTKYEAAKAEEAKLSKMFSQGFVARNQWEAARTTLSATESALNQARDRLESLRTTDTRSVIRARFAGVVVKRWHVAGDRVAAGEGDPILRVVDPAKVQAVVQVPGDRIDRVVSGQAATLQSDLSNEPAVVATKAAAAAAGTPTVEVRLNFVVPTALPIDTVVQAEIAVEDVADALLVPAGAVQRPADAPAFVWVAVQDRAQRREVRAGLSANGMTQILGGLAVGEEVITSGIAQLSEGITISINR
jgi:RND family efflux transporter MFP subunit